ncbi:MAG: UDP-N-acetylglucosamine 2-epimerase (hydrolyzing) [Treponema sp.]|nr:UDP-N-acetylglucosamine 2-epimerase (hydrolyzing) [Treponema sp.]
MKKICFVTAARSEYGLLKWLMHDIRDDDSFQLQLIVTGGHLLKEQGHTIDAIIADGFTVDATVDANLDVTSTETIAASMGRMAEKFAPVFAQLKPDLLVVLGDRYELLPICNTAFVMRIPIAHLSGGDVTEGAIDDGVRNAVTMLVDYHFPGTTDAAENIKRMRGTDKNIWVVGEPGLDAFKRVHLMTRNELAENLRLDVNKKWCLITYHSETRESIEYNLNAVKSCFNALQAHKDLQIVMTYANADFGGNQINELLEKKAKENPEQFKVVPSLGQLRYLSYMKQAGLVIGNSSSGIVEAPSLGIPVVNIGERQKGRYQCKNIIQCGNNFDAIASAVKEAFAKNVDTTDSSYWGTGEASKNIVRIVHKNIFME